MGVGSLAPTTADITAKGEPSFSSSSHNLSPQLPTVVATRAVLCVFPSRAVGSPAGHDRFRIVRKDLYLTDKTMAAGWEGWLANLKTLERCGLYGHDGNPWAQRNIESTADDIKKFLNAFNDPTDFQCNGASLSGIKFSYLRTEEDTMLLKGKGDNKEKNMTVCKTASGLVFGCSKDNSITGASVRILVESLAGSLRGHGY